MAHDRKDHYGAMARALHGLVLLAVLLQFILILLSKIVTAGPVIGFLFVLHKSIGIISFFLALIFIGWRFFHAKPQWPLSMKKWERCLARLVHILLYMLIFLMPLSGWIMSTAANKAPIFFFWFAWPFPGVSDNLALAHIAAEVHLVSAWALGGLVVIHVLAALKHFFVNKDGVLQRMFRRNQ